MEKPKREAILDLSKYVNERIRVKFTGGREGAPIIHLYIPGIEPLPSDWNFKRLRSIVESRA
jgi:hypothetical protein